VDGPLSPHDALAVVPRSPEAGAEFSVRVFGGLTGPKGDYESAMNGRGWRRVRSSPASGAWSYTWRFDPGGAKKQERTNLVVGLIFLVLLCGGGYELLSSSPSSSSGNSTHVASEPAPSPHECIVLALGGNKLCDEDAAAWCRATDETRKEYGDGASKANCAVIEAEYP
jgi:hypothetical protein